MNSRRLSRRTVLRGSGVSIALPLLETMRSDRAHASDSISAPRRLAFFYIPNGVVQSAWNLKDVGSRYQLSPTLNPIESVREEILILSNLDRVKVAGTDGHAQASTCWLSSAAPDELSPAGYPLKRTIDQIVADHTGQHTSFRSLELSCNPYEDNRESIYFDNISWFGHGHVARSIRDPIAVFNRLFRVEEYANSSSVLDLVMEDARDLQGKLSRQDRHKLSEYTDAVRTVEKQITRVRQRQNELAKLNPQTPIKAWQAMRRDEFIQVMGDLMILALQSDLTRVASLMTGPERWGSPLNVEGWFEKPIQHHSWTHGQHQEAIRKQLERLDQFHVEQFVQLVKKMQAIDEGEGTLLDHTAFMLGSGLSSGEHHVCNNLPTVIAGRCGGTIQTGQHVRYAEGTPIANLWRSLASAMGVELSRIGDSTGLIGEIAPT